MLAYAYMYIRRYLRSSISYTHVDILGHKVGASASLCHLRPVFIPWMI